MTSTEPEETIRESRERSAIQHVKKRGYFGRCSSAGGQLEWVG